MRAQDRAINRVLYGKSEPNRVYVDGLLMVSKAVDPDDYSNPLSDVRLGP